MGWETRKRGGRYYTRSVRVGGRVTREYIGGGRLGEAVAWLDQRERDERDFRASRERAAQAEDEALSGTLEEFGALVETLTAATLLLAGYHRPDRKRRWRKRRGAGQGAGDGDRPDQRAAAEGE